MIICQTLWANKRSLLEDSFGWLTPQYHLMSWALSVTKLSQHYKTIQLHTDNIGKKTLIDNLGLPYTTFFIDYEELTTPSYLWALPKILTYAKQNQPFLHTDGDVIAWKPLDKNILSGSLIAQNLEKGTIFNWSLFDPLLDELKYLPSFLRQNISLPDMRAYNAGIIGGSDLSFFKEFTSLALRIVEKNKDGNLTGNLNMIIEQLLFYSLAKKEKKKVTCLTEELINDGGYHLKDFADFPNVEKLKYLHLIGPHKRNKEVCDWLARYLQWENEEIYLRIINLFKKQHYFYGNKLKEIYPAIEPNTKNKFNYKRSESFIKSINPKTSFNSNTAISKYIETAENPILKDLFHYEQKLCRLCTKFAKIDFSRLKQLEEASMDSIRFLNMEKGDKASVMLYRNSYMEIVYTAFDWPNMQIANNGYVNVRMSNKKDITISIIPELFFSGYREILLDETCLNIIVLTETEISYKDLSDKMKMLFPSSKDEKEDEAFYKLIHQKVEYLIKNKLLFMEDD